MSEPNIHDRSTSSTNSTGSTTTGPQPAGPSSQSPTPRRGWDGIQDHIAANKLEFLLAISRALTIICTLSYLVGFPGDSANRFKQALLMTAATSSLRLHHRMPPPPFSQLNLGYLRTLVKEDSFHYLIFPFLFFFNQPVTLSLLPCCLYAVFNLAVYSIKLLDKFGGHEDIKLMISTLVQRYQQILLQTIARCELTLMGVVIIGVFTRAVGFLVPMMYYRFLMARYNSTRNAYLKSQVLQLFTFADGIMRRYIRT